MTQTPLPMHGVVDLAALAAQSKRAEGGLATVDEDGLQALAEQSLQTPVIIAFVSSRVPASDTVAAQLEAAVRERGGMIVAACDVDAQPAIAQAFQVSSVPAAVALIGARPAPLFQGAASREQLAQLVAQVAQVAQQSGLGAGAEQPAAAPEEPPLPPLIQEAYEAIDRGDLPAAESAFDMALAENPKDDEARVGRAQVRLMHRSRAADLTAVRAAAAAAPADVDAQMAVADLDVLGGQVEDAFVRLVDAVRVSAGPERDRVRERLLELFDVVGGQDQRVMRARQALASALY